MRRYVQTFATLMALCALGVSSLALANPRINTHIFRPTGHPGDLFTVLSTDLYESGHWSVGGLLDFGKNPLVFIDRSTDPDRRHEVLQDQLTLTLTGSVSIARWVDVSLALPLFLVNKGEEQGFVSIDPVDSFAVGDLRLSPKVRLLAREENEDGFGLAVDLLFVLPTGNADAFVSDGFSFQPGLLADYRVGLLHVAANLGYRIRSKEELLFLEVGNEIYYRLGAGVRLVGPEKAAATSETLEVTAIGELYGATDDFKSRNSSNLEGVLGARFGLPKSGLHFQLGGGSGFVKGYGNTKFRLFAGVGYAPPLTFDQDGDGIPDDEDACPTEPEDFDRFEDADGCPDPDNDKDGILDGVDRCPNDPEDVDGFEDADGCPDPDNDGDGVLDVSDNCPLEAEDKDGFQDEDGCPDPDNDGDGIPDLADQCPNEPEVFNGHQDDDGCPDQTLARVERDKIIILDKVYFDTDKATIKAVSFPVLNAVAGVLKANPNIKRIRIEGHTDDVGAANYNRNLSDARAKSVMEYLVKEGIAAERLEAVGYGEDRPAVEGTTKEAREKNRRVEFTILEQ